MMIATLVLALQAVNCTTIGTTTRCAREGPVAPVDYGAAMNRARTRPVRPDQRGDQVRQEVGRLVAAKRCDEAKGVALKAGDLDLAEQAERLCR